MVYPGQEIKKCTSSSVSSLHIGPGIHCLRILRRNINPSIIVLSFVTRIQLKVVSLSEESRNEAKPVLMVFRHVDT